MSEHGLEGEARAQEAAVELERTLSLLSEADEEASKFKRYLHDNHWADKARKLWSARTV